MNDALASEIVRMADEEQHLRKTVEAAHKELSSVDARNMQRLREIVEESGWPTRSKVGTQAEHLAWLLVQHADHDVEFQRRCLALMARESPDEVCPRHLAYLEDRIRVAEGRPQRYGTQLTMTEDGLDARLLEDPDGVDARRDAVGLGPIAEYVRQSREAPS